MWQDREIKEVLLSEVCSRSAFARKKEKIALLHSICVCLAHVYIYTQTAKFIYVFPEESTPIYEVYTEVDKERKQQARAIGFCRIHRAVRVW